PFPAKLLSAGHHTSFNIRMPLHSSNVAARTFHFSKQRSISFLLSTQPPYDYSYPHLITSSFSKIKEMNAAKSWSVPSSRLYSPSINHGAFSIPAKKQ
ncbi:hypothetical protein VIGAN_UM054800, partial [Vigna angularis var. angularis]